MQFNSYIFILAFLPVFLAAYFLLGRRNATIRKGVIIAGGAVFYLWGGLALALIFGLSILVNYLFALVLTRIRKHKRLVLGIAVAVNIGLLFYFKYFNFFLTGLNQFFQTDFVMREIALPLGISFFTFQQIMYLVNVERGELKDLSLIDYLAYILYFPKLIMGPLTEPKFLLDQFQKEKTGLIDPVNVADGLKIFAFGLFKKVIFADMLSKVVASGLTNVDALTSADTLLLMLSYTFEIYFDFSGYSDMAEGVSVMLNIDLPMNFDSPYKALSVRDFWKRWHMSLTGFLTKYIYFPLGGSRKGKARTYLNTMIVFLVSGIWHGANWTFILWGILHGAFSVFDRLKDKVWNKLFKPIRWLLTFLVINVLWLLFTASSIHEWLTMMGRLLSFSDLSVSPFLTEALPDVSGIISRLGLTSLFPTAGTALLLGFLVLSFLICLIPQNNVRRLRKNSLPTMLVAALVLLVSILFLSGESVFVYFNF